MFAWLSLQAKSASIPDVTGVAQFYNSAWTMTLGQLDDGAKFSLLVLGFK